MASSPHRRIASDDTSASSQSWHDEQYGPSHQTSSASADSRSWLAISSTDHSDPSEAGMPGIKAPGSELGLSYSPRPRDALPTMHPSPSAAASSRRPKPTPFQLEDDSAYGSPAGSFRSKFSPQAQFQRSRTDSRSHLLNTPTASDWTRTPRTPPAYTLGLPRQTWRWKWHRLWWMYVFLLFGFCCALGHHLFYATLNGRPAENQLAMLRYGTILAFAAKAGFVAAVVTAYRQRIWATMRNKLLSVGALDSLFAATEDLSALMNAEIFQKAKVATFLVALIWLTPLVIILTSNTLLVELVENMDDTKCPNIRTINLTKEETEEFRDPTEVNGLHALSLSYWNTTSWNQSDPNWFDYYTGPADVFTATANLGIYSHHVMAAKDASLRICGSGWNCTYSVNFVAPGYKCSELASGAGSPLQRFGNHQAPFETDKLLPAGNFSYYAHVTAGDYAGEQMDKVDIGGIPSTKPPYPPHLGAFRTEPVLWMGYVVPTSNDPLPNNRTQPGWNDAYTPKIFACELYETAYDVEFKLQGNDQSTSVTKREFLHPVMNTSYVWGKDANDGTHDNATAVPESGYVYPRDKTLYRRVAAYHSLSVALRNAINGTVTSQQVNTPMANTKAVQTKLLNAHQQYFPYNNLQVLVQDLFEDIILSMFSNFQLVSVVWAARPDETSGDSLGDESTLYPCLRMRWENRYKYVARDLWIVYSCTFICAIVAVFLGTAAVLENDGRLYDTRFSSIVAATRGPALEKVMWKEDKGDLPRDVKNLKVGYGLVNRPGGYGVVTTEDTSYPERSLWDGGPVRYGFGLEGDVRQFKSEGSLFRGRS